MIFFYDVLLFFLFFCCYFVAQIFQATKVVTKSVSILYASVYGDRKLSLSSKTFEKKKKKGLIPQMDSAPNCYLCFRHNNNK